MPMILSVYRSVLGVLRHRRGAVMMMFAMALPVLVFAIGMGIDYARAMKAQTKMNAVADSAALSAVSKVAMGMNDAAAVAYARRIFDAQVLSLTQSGDIVMGDVTINAPTDGNGRRNATVTYKAVSNNIFAKILGLNTLAIAGRSQTTNAVAPDINFYMLLDVSSSMALPTTSAGLAKVAASNTQNCQFACHSVNDPIKGRNAKGKTTDLYGVAKSYGLTLRIDDEGTAVSKLTTNATNTSSKTGAKYQIAVATFRGSGGFNVPQTLTGVMSDVIRATNNLVPYNYDRNGCPTSACKSTEVGYNDADTGTSDAMTRVNAIITTPGTGINNAPAQAVLFLVTDGMRDELRGSGSGGYPEIAIDTVPCATIKARGVRIAVLYTEYLPESLTGDWWSETYIKPNLYKIEPALQACASPGLYTKVSTDQDISAAMAALFQNAVATARITQ